MRSSQYRGMVCGSLLVLGLSVAGAASSPALAQDTTGMRGMQTQTQTNGDDDHDWGWVGLLGLAGLLGLRRRDNHVHVDHVDTTRTNRL
jgi:MYXO-CTERM domain-containing protein